VISGPKFTELSSHNAVGIEVENVEFTCPILNNYFHPFRTFEDIRRQILKSSEIWPNFAFLALNFLGGGPRNFGPGL